MILAIVFPVFNGLSYTKKCLDSLFSNHISKELNDRILVIIVDDGSTDGTFDWLTKHYPQVYVLKGTGNLWWSGGINMAVKYAINQLNVDYVLWWNNDIFADSDYFKNLMSHLNINNPKTIIGSKIYHAHDKELIWSMGGLFDAKTGQKSLIGTAQPDNSEYSIKTECDWLPGMGTITHSSVYDQVGWLDEKKFPQYHGDSDFTFRAKKMGYNIVVFPDLKIYNDTRHSGLRHNDSFKKLIASLFTIRSNYNVKKDILFYKKHITSYKAYRILIQKYYRYIGGFIKWKLLGLSGKKRFK